MVKVYCDRCGKELKTDDPYYYPLGDAANGDDIFFTISVNNRKSTIYHPGNHKDVRVVDNLPNFRYEYNAPDLCTDCMRVINNAVKTVWDGKRKDS